MRRMQRPVGIAQQLAGEENHIGLASGYDLLGLFSCSDQADCSDRDTHALPDGRSEGRLEAGASRYPGIGCQAAA